MIGVSGSSPRYLTAVAGLPLRTQVVDDVRGAVMIVEGSPGWPHRSLAALHDGAAALIIAHPVAVDDEEIVALASLAGRAPIVLDRPRLRADVVADATATDAARHVTADAVAVASELSAVVRDAIGWLRVLAGGELELRSAASLPHGVLALFEASASGRAATLTASALSGRGGARLRAHAVGETRVEVDLDAATDARSVQVIGVDGGLHRPRRHESSERLALRRTVDALASATLPGDLREFRHDCALAAQCLASE